MKINKLIISSFAIFATMAVLPACKKSFVNLTPQGIIPVSTSYTTEIDIRNALTGTYSSLRPIYNEQYGFGEIPSDNAETYGESEALYGEQDKLTWAPTSTNLQNAWARYYATIAYANIVLGHADTPPMSDANRNSYKAQAKFLRALMYFNLVRMFGGVPLILKELVTEEEAYTYLRATPAEVYAQIEKDLTEAAAVLPVSYTGTDIGRATSIAANGLLGKVLMFQNKYTQAEPVLAAVAATSGTLLPFDQVFGLGKDNSREFIFSVQYLSGGYSEGNTFARSFVPQPSGTTITTFVTGNSNNSGTRNLYNAFETGDNRLTTSIGTYASGTLNYYYAKKFVYSSVIGTSEGDNDWPVLRYGDVILLYAEALNENGKTTEALTQLNLVRTRAGLVGRTGLLQAAARTAIRNERRIELAFEAERWFDLIRWNTYVEVMTAFKAGGSANGTIGAITTTLNLFPIPLRERQLNPRLTQNPGY
ncbi:RagB/SusD family nutrient uptake outer membrane protein [Mucilaginibacter myungsuensis]|uniref:RagB/SusD family nutrient uptake outer membrane protein n=1 Tax=Mucilaginibacter myungsuensis TaxID=649104 RepID=A0A929KUN9_9SPHI|nr:RagB/SusD family nutrient uptake outer membrane protein [Mucilaginibacter myungsuensis]MBE9660775.1 RagB/SusD family nutrient uptake outer membrane protein [Mucilaginibacter myungsuensis]MDN3600820.1 RagB/SusD family nutrient uptake outer membrane protein [Mucilaginibacter myungsuensis]